MEERFKCPNAYMNGSNKKKKKNCILYGIKDTFGYTKAYLKMEHFINVLPGPTAGDVNK